MQARRVFYPKKPLCGDGFIMVGIYTANSETPISHTLLSHTLLASYIPMTHPQFPTKNYAFFLVGKILIQSLFCQQSLDIISILRTGNPETLNETLPSGKLRLCELENPPFFGRSMGARTNFMAEKSPRHGSSGNDRERFSEWDPSAKFRIFMGINGINHQSMAGLVSCLTSMITTIINLFFRLLSSMRLIIII